MRAQEQVDAEYRNTALWARKSILCTAGMGKFSSDRTVLEYANDIWNIKVRPRPAPRRGGEGRGGPRADEG